MNNVIKCAHISKIIYELFDETIFSEDDFKYVLRPFVEWDMQIRFNHASREVEIEAFSSSISLESMYRGIFLILFRNGANEGDLIQLIKDANNIGIVGFVSVQDILNNLDVRHEGLVNEILWDLEEYGWVDVNLKDAWSQYKEESKNKETIH